MQHTLLKGDSSNAFFFQDSDPNLQMFGTQNLMQLFLMQQWTKQKKTSVKVVEMTHALWRNGSIWVLSNSKNAEIDWVNYSFGLRCSWIKG